MRRVPVDKIQEGYKIGKTVYNSDGTILIREGTTIKAKMKTKLLNLGYSSIYITDALSSEPLDDMIDPVTRIGSIKDVKNAFDVYKLKIKRLNISNASHMKKDKKEEYQSIAKITNAGTDIVEELLGRKENVINMVDIKNVDGYLYQHSVNVAVLAVTFGIKLGYTHDQLNNLAIGGMLHDIGYNFLDYDIINVEGELSDDAKEVIRSHPIVGYEHLKENIDINGHIRMMVYQHHEWINGSGYPLGLKADEISEYAKIIAIVDTYDALTSDRPHRKALDPQEANERMLGACLEQLDADLVKQFVKVIIPYPIGTVIKLTNDEIGVVIGVDTEFPLRPIVRVVEQDGRKVKLYERNLMEEHTISIANVQYELPEELLESY